MKAALWVVLAATPAGAHAPPIHPAQVELRLDPGRIRLLLAGDAVYFQLESLAPNLGEGGFDEKRRTAFADYLRRHVALAADGAPLAGRLVSADVTQPPWAGLEPIGAWGRDGVLRARVDFPLPEGARSVEFRSQIFLAEWKEHLGQPPLDVPYPRVFGTDLSVPGRRRLARRLTLEEPDFAFAAVDGRRTGLQAALESASFGLAAAGLPALLAGLAGGLLLSSRSASLVAAAVGAALAAWAGAGNGLAGLLGSDAAARVVAMLGGAAAGPLGALAAARLGAFWRARIEREWAEPHGIWDRHRRAAAVACGALCAVYIYSLLAGPR